MNLPIKYRPIEFAQVVGQRVAVAIAQASLAQTPLQTTFLLVGASGSGKTTLARIMARSLNCKEKVGVEPCNQCSSCLSHLNDNHLAIKEINGADKNGVDDVRGIIERCQINTLDSKYRIFIVDECHQMSKPAQNAMLKLLEDPPQDTIFILCTTEEDKLLETIRSRARILRFQTVSRDLVTGYLLNVAYHEGIALTEQEAQKIYEYNKGSIRQSLQTLGTVCDRVSVADLCPQIARDELQSLFIAFENRDYFGIDRILQKVCQQGFYPKQLLTNLMDLAIELMAIPETSPHFVANADRMLEVVIPAISKLGNSSNAQANCRLTLYHALTVWQSSDGKETLEATTMNVPITDTPPLPISQSLPNQVQTQPQLLSDLQVGSATYANHLLASSVSTPQHQFAIPTGHRPYTP
ncbi:MAG: DNA polymerase III subunit gamma/tau [Hydrococcus sp. SU_1_0]|nr:DNA polymerase III subunit gamma/tau [Hydrococcus sp. SU_1_0]NJO96719.1 DNA polymerase III subunit gamma/tau [Pleurocapsa sp. CRU_1_2]